MDLGIYKGKRALVTGHSGFKGGWLALWLSQLETVVCGYSLVPNTSPSLFYAADIGSLCDQSLWADTRDRAAVSDVVRGFKPDIVFHLAAQPIVRDSYDDPLGTINTNVVGALNVIEAVRNAEPRPKLVLVTSDKCYENREWVWGYREDEALGGIDPYSASKAMVEVMAASYQRSFFVGEATLATARAGNVIGGGDWASHRIVPDMVRAFSGGAEPLVRNPDSVRPWQHVLEPLSGYLWLGARLLAGDASAAGPWNFGPDPNRAYTVGELHYKMAQLWHWKPERKMPVPGAHEAKYLTLSIEKAARAGWHPRLSFDETVQWTYDWYQRFYDDYKPALLRDLMAEQIRTYTWDRNL